MQQADVGSLSQFLNYGGLGLLAILCLVVLGYNAWNLNNLIATAPPERVTAARPLLLWQMALSLVGLLMVGAGGIYLERVKAEDNKKRIAQVILDPWDDDLDIKYRPLIEVGGKRPDKIRPIEVLCTSNEFPIVRINVERYVRHRIESSLMAQNLLLPPIAGAR